MRSITLRAYKTRLCQYTTHLDLDLEIPIDQPLAGVELLLQDRSLRVTFEVEEEKEGDGLDTEPMEQAEASAVAGLAESDQRPRSAMETSVPESATDEEDALARVEEAAEQATEELLDPATRQSRRKYYTTTGAVMSVWQNQWGEFVLCRQLRPGGKRCQFAKEQFTRFRSLVEALQVLDELAAAHGWATQPIGKPAPMAEVVEPVRNPIPDDLPNPYDEMEAEAEGEPEAVAQEPSEDEAAMPEPDQPDQPNQPDQPGEAASSPISGLANPEGLIAKHKYAPTLYRVRKGEKPLTLHLVRLNIRGQAMPIPVTSEFFAKTYELVPAVRLTHARETFTIARVGDVVEELDNSDVVGQVVEIDDNGHVHVRISQDDVLMLSYRDLLENWGLNNLQQGPFVRRSDETMQDARRV